jgi:hypothetical protein
VRIALFQAKSLGSFVGWRRLHLASILLTGTPWPAATRRVSLSIRDEVNE